MVKNTFKYKVNYKNGDTLCVDYYTLLSDAKHRVEHLEEIGYTCIRIESI